MGGSDTFNNIKLQHSNVNTRLACFTTFHSSHGQGNRMNPE